MDVERCFVSSGEDTGRTRSLLRSDRGGVIGDRAEFIENRGDVRRSFVSPGEDTGRAGEHSYE